jgi:hypothetical protein
MGAAELLIIIVAISVVVGPFVVCTIGIRNAVRRRRLGQKSQSAVVWALVMTLASLAVTFTDAFRFSFILNVKPVLLVLSALWLSFALYANWKAGINDRKSTEGEEDSP